MLSSKVSVDHNCHGYLSGRIVRMTHGSVCWMAGEDLEHEKQDSKQLIKHTNEEERFGTKQPVEGSGGVSGLSNPTGRAR